MFCSSLPKLAERTATAEETVAIINQSLVPDSGTVTVTSEKNSNRSESVFVGDSEMTVLMRAFDWSQTSLGAVDPARLYEEHDVSVATRAKARLEAAANGQEPPVVPVLGAPGAAAPDKK